MDEVKQIIIPRGCSPYTARLIELLKDGKPGDEISDEELTQYCGKATHVHGDGYSYLQTATDYCATVYGIRWQRIYGQHRLRCLTPSGLVGSVGSQLSGIGRRAKRAAIDISIAAEGELSEEEKPRIRLLAAQVGALAMMTSSRMRKRLEKLPTPKEPDMKLLVASFGTENGQSTS